MKKRIIPIFVIACLVLLAAPSALGAESLSNFDAIQKYNGGFTDIAPSAWYYSGIRGVYEYGIMDGKGAGIFDPSGSLTIAETIKIAATLHKCYYTGSMSFKAGSPWYAPYVEYALENDIPAAAYRNLNTAATRSDFAIIITAAMPDEAITPINRIADGAIPDVFESYSYGQAVYKLYRAGVLTGSDDKGTFYPGRTLTRAEAASIIMRIVKANTRASLSLVIELTAEEIYKKASPAVFYVEILDNKDEVLKTGSGLFISESGLAITNYHVVVGASKMQITTDDGTVFKVAGIYDYDWKMDAALIQVEGEGFPYLELADSSAILAGATVYALGSPMGLQASFSRGIVSQALRKIEGSEFIQLDAAISSGSSGGALLDTSGRVVGVTTATMVDAQNINLAVPVGFFSKLSLEKYVPIESILITTPYYVDNYPAPDFGAFYDVYPFNLETAWGETSYSYRLSDFPGDTDEIIDEYTHIVEQNFFSLTGYLDSGSVTYKRYYNSEHDVLLTFGIDKVRNHECFTVIVE